MRLNWLAVLSVLALSGSLAQGQFIFQNASPNWGDTATNNWNQGIGARPGSSTVSTNIDLAQITTTGTVGLNIDFGTTGSGVGAPYYLGAIDYAPASGTNAWTFGGNGTTAGTLVLNGTTVNSVNNVYLANRSASASTLVLAPTNGGTGAMTVNFNNPSGVIIVNTGNTIQLGANATGTGAITIQGGGTFQVGSGGTTGSLSSGAITISAGTLNFNRTNTLTVANAISGSGNLTQAGTGTTILTGTNSYGTTTISAGTLQIGNGGAAGTLGTGNVTNNAALTFSRSDAITVGNFISGSGNLTKSGTNDLTLTANNNYSGTTTISGGRIILGSGGTTGTLGTGAVTNNGQIVYNRTDSSTIAGNISGTGSVSFQFGLSGTPTLILAGNNTYSGNTTVINNGIVQIGNGGATGSLTASNVNLAAGSTLIFNSTTDWTFAGAISGSTTLNQNGTNTVTLSNSNTFQGNTRINSGALSIAADSGLGAAPFLTVPDAIILNGTLRTTANLSLVDTRGVLLGPNGGAGTGTFDVAASTSATVQGIIANNGGTGALAKNGAGTLILTNTNTYTGTTNVTLGTVQLGNGGASGAIAGGTVNVSAGATFAVNRNDTFTFGNTIAGAGNVANSGPGTTILTNNNTGLSGGANVTAGTLQIGNSSTAGNVGTATVNVSSGATFNIARNEATFTFLNTINGAGTVSYGQGNTLIITGTNGISGSFNITSGTLQVGAAGSVGTLGTAGVSLDSGTTLRTNRTDTALVIPGVISGNGSVVQQGTGTATLTGNNSYAGGTNVNAGILQIGNATASGTFGSGTATIASGATLQITRTDNPVFANTITGGGILTQAGSGNTSLTGANTISGNVNVVNGTLTMGNGGTAGTVGTATVNISTGATFAINRSDSLIFSNVMTGPGNFNYGVSGQTVTISGANTISGNVNVTNGTVQLGNADTTGSVGTATVNVSAPGTFAINRSDAFNFANLITGAGTFNKLGSNLVSLTGTNTISGTVNVTNGILQVGNGGSTGTLGTAAVSIASGATLQTNRTDTGLVLGNTISGQGAFTQTGTGTVTLTGTNSYTGATTVAGGVLLINGTSTGSSFSVNSGLLGGTGTIGGSVTVVSGGALQGGTGAASGTLSLSNANTGINTGGAIRANIAAAGANSGINFGGNSLNLAGTGSVVRLVGQSGFTNTAPAAWTIGTSIGTLNLGGTPQASGTVVGNVFVGSAQTAPVTIDLSTFGSTLTTGDIFWLTYSNNNLVLNFAPVPEPATILGISALGLGGLALLRRRMRANTANLKA